MPSALETCTKYITFFFNLLFAITGIVIFAVGLIVQVKYNHYSNFVGDHVWTVPIILMIIGLVVGFICFLGCCGAMKENSFMILGFVVLSVLVFLFEIGLGTAGYIKHAGLRTGMEEQFNTTMEQYTERKEFRDIWSMMQSELSCCGIYGPSDWERVTHNSTIPPSCCSVINLDEASECTIKHAHPDGCFNKLLFIIDSNTLLLAFVVLGLAGIQLLTIAFAVCLFRSYGEKYEVV